VANTNEKQNQLYALLKAERDNLEIEKVFAKISNT